MRRARSRSARSRPRSWLWLIIGVAALAMVIGVSVYIGRQTAPVAQSQPATSTQPPSSAIPADNAGSKQAAGCVDARFNMPLGIERDPSPVPFITWFVNSMSIAPQTLTHSADEYQESVLKDTVGFDNRWEKAGFNPMWPEVFIGEAFQKIWQLGDVAGYKDLQKTGGQRCVSTVRVSEQPLDWVRDKFNKEGSDAVIEQIKATHSKLYRVEYNMLEVEPGSVASSEVKRVDAVVVWRSPSTNRWYIAGMWRIS